jgi:hypothetical protein
MSRARFDGGIPMRCDCCTLRAHSRTRGGKNYFARVWYDGEETTWQGLATRLRMNVKSLHWRVANGKCLKERGPAAKTNQMARGLREAEYAQLAQRFNRLRWPSMEGV